MTGTVTDRLDYEDATRHCGWCGMRAPHSRPADCILDMMEALPEKRLVRVIAYMREQIATLPIRNTASVIAAAASLGD